MMTLSPKSLHFSEITTYFQCSPFIPLGLWFYDVLSGYRIATLLELALISSWKFWWVISFLLKIFVRINWIAETRLIFVWIYFQGCQSLNFLHGLIFKNEFKFSFWIFHVTSQGCVVKESYLTLLSVVV